MMLLDDLTRMKRFLFPLMAVLVLHSSLANALIDRMNVVRSFNPYRNASSLSTPMMVGNGNFAFGADITGLQSILPYNILSSWGWHNDSLPTTPGQTSPSDFTGLDWWTHGRLVNYEQPNPAEPDISQWMIANPNRINLGRVAIQIDDMELSEDELLDKSQYTDLYSGVVYSTFSYNGQQVNVQTTCAPDSDTIGIQIQSQLISQGRLSVFFDYPYASGADKFDDPFVGVWNATQNHTTQLNANGNYAQIQHTMQATSYYNTIVTEGDATISGPIQGTHRYVLTPSTTADSLSFISNYDGSPLTQALNFNTVKDDSVAWWADYWSSGGFVDLSGTNNANATELQRRTILSQYLLAVNEAPNGQSPQESGLTNNGWYGKFHMEMVFWHLGHWGRWSKWSMTSRSLPAVYDNFLPTSIQRAGMQGYSGARWGKMSDPSGRSAPGEINSLLIWQQPHPMYLAEMEYRSLPTDQTLQKWDTILVESADFMTSFAFYNSSTNVYDLGPPMYPVSETTPPNATVNPAFEIAYWRFGLNIASEWQRRQNKTVPTSWTNVYNNLAPLPIQNNTYVLYEGIPNMWNDTTIDEDHPAFLGLYGWLPPDPTLSMPVLENTVTKVYQTWNFTYSYGWDFPLLAMNSLRMGDADQAVDWLLYSAYQFDDIGMPIGGARVPTPYFPGSSSLLFAVAMMAGGWDGGEGPHFPGGWNVTVEGFTPMM